MGVVVGLVHEQSTVKRAAILGPRLQHTNTLHLKHNSTIHILHIQKLDPAQTLATTNTLRIEWATDMIEESGISWGSHEGDATRRGRGGDVQV